MDHRRCRIMLVLGIAASCVGTYAGIRLMGTDDMTIDQAMSVLGESLTPQQRKIVASALRRNSLAAVRQLLTMARMDDAAGIEAKAAILQLREVLLK